MARKLTVGKISKISIYQRSTGRWIVTWYDEQGLRHHTTCATQKEAEVIQRQKRADLERHRETRFDVDDRQMFCPGAGSRRCEIRMAALACAWRPGRHPDRRRNIPHQVGMLQMEPADYRSGPAITKINERRHVPICDRLIDRLKSGRRESGPVINLKKPEDETERLARVTGTPWRRNALRHSFCS